MSLAYRVAGAGFSYGLYLLIPLFFGLNELGIFGLFQAWVASLGVLVTMGLNVTLLKTVAREGSARKSMKHYKRALSLSLPFAYAVSGALCLAAPMIQSEFPEVVTSKLTVYALALVLPFQALLVINIEMIRGLMNIKASELFRNLISYAIATVVMLFAYFVFQLPNPSVLGMTAGIVISAVASGICVLWFVQKDPTQFKAQKAGEPAFAWLKNALPIMVASLLQTWNARLMVLMLGFMAPLEVVGIFSLAFKLSTIPDFIVSAVKAPAAPRISKLFWSQQWQNLDQMLQSSARLITNFTIPVSLVLIAFAEPILGLVGSEFSSGVNAFRILMLGQIIAALTGLTGTFMNMTNNHLYLLMAVSIGVALNAAFGWLLIPEYGMTGAAIGYLAGSVSLNVITALQVRRKYKLSTFYRPFKNLNRTLT